MEVSPALVEQELEGETEERRPCGDSGSLCCSRAGRSPEGRSPGLPSARHSSAGEWRPSVRSPVQFIGGSTAYNSA